MSPNCGFIITILSLWSYNAV